MSESPVCDTNPSCNRKNVWLVTQHHPVDGSFPFVVEAAGIELSIDFSNAHHRCCWTRTMLGPIWASLQEILSPFAETAGPEPADPEDNAVSVHTQCSLLEKQRVLSHVLSSIRELLKRQQGEQLPKRGVWRVRFVHAVPDLICFGKAISSELCITLSLRSMCHTRMVMFPSFIAIQPTESTSAIMKLKFPRKQRHHGSKTQAETILLPLQHINAEGTVASYMSLLVDLCYNGSLPEAVEPLLMSFRIFAAFYDSPEDQVKLDEPFTNLQEGRSNVTREERFGVMSPAMDPDVVFSTEKRSDVKLKRHIKLAVDHMDGCTKVKATAPSPKASLRHVATMQSAIPVSLQLCEKPGCCTLAAVLPNSVQWPLQLRVSDAHSGRTGLTRLIPGSVSLDRLANELESLYSQITPNEEQ